jgi:ADP-ribose pyrophosphatase
VFKRTSKVKILSSEKMFTGRVFGVRRDQLIEPTGVRTTREIVAHPGSVVVLPVFDDGKVLIIRQYRYAAGQFMWELVAGHREPTEDFRRGAARELQEETGYTARRYRKLLEIYPSPGLLSERMVIFLAEGLTKGQARPEDDEKIEARILTLGEVEAWIRSGKIRDAKTISGLLYYAAFVRQKRKR